MRVNNINWEQQLRSSLCVYKQSAEKENKKKSEKPIVKFSITKLNPPFSPLQYHIDFIEPSMPEKFED